MLYVVLRFIIEWAIIIAIILFCRRYEEKLARVPKSIKVIATVFFVMAFIAVVVKRALY